MWTRRLSLNMGFEQEDFVNAFVRALSEEKVIRKLETAICGQLIKEVGELRNIVKVRDKEIVTLKTEIQSLKVNVDDLEQYSRRQNLRLTGVPEYDHEDLVRVSIDLINKNVCPSNPISVSDIDRVHRVGRRGGDVTSRPILIRFATYCVRERVFKNRFLLNPKRRRGPPGDPWRMTEPERKDDQDTKRKEGGDKQDGEPGHEPGQRGGEDGNLEESNGVEQIDGVGHDRDIGSGPGNEGNQTEQAGVTSQSGMTNVVRQKIFINEDLTKYRASLMWQARTAKKKGSINDCWTVDGKVMLKNKSNTIVNIKTAEDLQQLINM